MDQVSDKYLEENPLMAFSFYTHYQTGILIRVGQDIAALLDKGIEGNFALHTDFGKAHGYFWLWVLGAFEVIRTMHTGRARFSSEVQVKIGIIKRKLVKIRMPFAKQRYAGRNQGILGEFSVSGFDAERNDFYFSIEGEEYWVKLLIEEFSQFIESIRLKDIVPDENGSKSSKLRS